MIKHKIVTLCGSIKFEKKFIEVREDLILKGYSVLTPIFPSHFSTNPVTKNVKETFRNIHRQKIDISDEILVINVNGYIGEDTKSEIEYAKNKGIRVEYLEKI